MTFIGESGYPAPLLKDATLDESQARKLYLDCVKMMHRFFNEAKLVHADLSEFNMLLVLLKIKNKFLFKDLFIYLKKNRFFKEHIYVIDVSQSVEHDHPHALDFLRKDCGNVNGKSIWGFFCIDNKLSHLENI
jgi:RIO kinase 1